MEELNPQTIAMLNQEQALAVFTSAGEAVRSLINQRWQVTYYVLAAYVALATAPNWITTCQNYARGACAFAAFLTAVPASWHLWNLWEQHDRRIDNLKAAANQLSVVPELLGWDKAPPPGPGSSYLALIAAVIVGAGLVIWINVSRIVTSRRTAARFEHRSLGGASAHQPPGSA